MAGVKDMEAKMEQENKTIVLVGGGHAHVYFIKKISKDRINGVKVKLVSAYKKQYYSGMASAFMEDIYEADEISFDLPEICESSGVEFIEGYVNKIEPMERNIFLENGKRVSFDILSLDIGSDAAGKNIQGVNLYGITIKPLNNILKIKELIKNIQGKSFHVLIAGGGAAGIETSLAIKEYTKKMNKNIKISIINSGDAILKGYPSKVKEKITKVIQKNEILIYLNERILAVEKNAVKTEKNNRLAFDMLIWATGTAASPLIRKSGLKMDKKGFMLVKPTLQSENYPYIFGAGDCIAFSHYDYVKKVGVYAIREAPVLWKNVMGYLGNEKVEKFIPPKSYLAIISIGGKLAVLTYKKIVLKGRLAWYLKNIIDRKFMRKFKLEKQRMKERD
jgi:pyridine nucleotide-disulfide oxidoreductase family protein